MDYKKLYEKAVERAKTLTNSGFNDFDFVKHIFPELAESEDEKMRKGIIRNLEYLMDRAEGFVKDELKERIAWLEKQGKCKINYPQNHQDSSYPNGCIVLEDFNGGEGFYKVHLDYLNKKQVEEVEEMVRMWNKELKTSNRNIKNCIEMCLADADEQRFKDYNTNLKECLSWLEKQYADPIKEYWRGYNEGKQNVLDKYAEIEKQGEQKSAEFKPLFRVGDVIKPKDPVLGEPRIIKGIHPKFGYDTNNGILDFEFEDNWELVEQKPADKVEPKFKVGDKIYLRPEYRMPNDDTPIADTIHEIIAIDDKHYRFEGSFIFIEDQDKYELVEKKPAEWSEEDETMTTNIIIMLKEGASLHFNKNDIAKGVDWLKSLRPQSHWKPSDEQMGVLLSEVTAWTKGCPKQIVLESLYNDLLKLKG